MTSLIHYTYYVILKMCALLEGTGNDECRGILRLSL